MSAGQLAAQRGPEFITAEHRETLGQALADAVAHRDPGGRCDACEASPAGVCDDHAADLGLTDAYIQLAAELRIEIPGSGP
jgi:hypothetical protein